MDQTLAQILQTLYVTTKERDELQAENAQLKTEVANLESDIQHERPPFVAECSTGTP